MFFPIAMKGSASLSEHGSGSLGESDDMNWNGASLVSLLAGVLAVAGARPARAGAASGCAAVAVVTNAALDQRWPELPAQIRETFRGRADVDGCARIQLAAVGSTIELTVTLTDGRTAFRVVARREDVLPALEALLLVPGAGEAGDEGSGAPPPAAPRPPAIAPAIARAAAPPPSSDRPAPFRIELALEAEARAGIGWTGAGAGMASFLDVGHWLAGFGGRIDRYQSLDTGLDAVALELTALGGHRFGLGGRRTLDIVAGPALARHGTAAMVVQMTSTGMTVTQTSRNEGLLRLVVSSRLTFGAASLVRTFIQIDADIGSATPDGAPGLNDPGLPPWTVGLALGAALGTR